MDLCRRQYYKIYDGYSENRLSHVDFYSLENGVFSKLYTLEASFPDNSPSYTLNGTKISMVEYAGYVSDGLTEFYARYMTLEDFERYQSDLSEIYSQISP